MADKHEDLMMSLGEIKGTLKVHRDEVKSRFDQHTDKIQNVEGTMAKICESIEHHIKRTDLLEDMVQPLHRKEIEANAVKAYKKKTREELMYSLKMPVAVVTALGAIGAMLNWLVG